MLTLCPVFNQVNVEGGSELLHSIYCVETEIFLTQLDVLSFVGFGL